jgi:putative nucleotidyltransferase with HDIG domain
MEHFGVIVQALERRAQAVLSGWPPEWQGFHWPGYTYEHTLRVRNLAVAMAWHMGADGQVVEMAALLHDIGKPAGEPHGDIGAQRAEAILDELGVDASARSRVCDLIRTHLAPDPAYPLENLALSDADYIDANFGYVAFTRYITIRAGRGTNAEEAISSAGDWLVRVSDRRKKVISAVGQAITEERFARMAPFLDALREGLRGETEEGKAAIGIARYLAADAHRPSLFRQVAHMEKTLRALDGQELDGLHPSPFLNHFANLLQKEISGQR